MNEIKRRSAALLDLDKSHTWLLEAAAKLSRSNQTHYKRCVQCLNAVDQLRQDIALASISKMKGVARV